MRELVFPDDLMRPRTGQGSKDMATLKHMAMNLVRIVPGKARSKTNRKSAGWDQEYLKTIMIQAGN